jgi:hypothetical protein
LAAAARILTELTKLSGELANQGHRAVQKRLSNVVGREITTAELATAVAHLSPENMSAPERKWFGNTNAGTADDQSSVVAGGWLRNDETYSLRYLPTGHDDAFATAWINLLAEATRGPRSTTAEKLLNEIMKSTAPGMCGSCHSVDRHPAGGLAVNWVAKEPRTERIFTFFSHAPHVLQAGPTECASCHRYAENADVMATYAQENPTSFVAGFHSLTKQDCASCHHSGAAGDSCTQCHRYHVEQH